MTAPLALTCGDPSGIGPEITLKAWDRLKDEVRLFLISDADYMAEMGARAGIRIHRIEAPEQADAAGGLPVLHEPFTERPAPGRVQLANAAATIRSIDRAVRFAMQGRAGAVVTNPITKKVLADGAGFAHPGHTEFLAALGGVDLSVMMLAAPELRVVPVTIHIPLSEVPRALTADLLMETARVTDAALRRDLGLERPRLAVAGLNPHAGEGGLMGTEDEALIRPAVEALRAEGLDITGPWPADTMFHAKARAGYDVALCMYHDQALIPLKTLNFSDGVNVTLGLPFVRTSPDHGTAYDIAGRGVADPASLIAAIRLAAEMADFRAASA